MTIDFFFVVSFFIVFEFDDFICMERELELKRHGLKLLRRNPSSFTPCLDGRYLLLGPDKELNHAEISKFSNKDAEAYPRLLLPPLPKPQRFRGSY